MCMPSGIPESTAAFQPHQNTWCSLGVEAMTGPLSTSVTRPALHRVKQHRFIRYSKVAYHQKQTRTHISRPMFHLRGLWCPAPGESPRESLVAHLVWHL